MPKRLPEAEFAEFAGKEINKAVVAMRGRAASHLSVSMYLFAAAFTELHEEEHIPPIERMKFMDSLVADMRKNWLAMYENKAGSA